ncbi:ATP-binding cassette, subfamily C, LapB [Vreelandella subterranea]|uniref:ATP-binding cassette, subfamily C, LapB n=1 Tax=Vreelandella subterranea TaxID=416874 RepID=A0A1H9VLW2_9GAMM|nr:type I secretion system permease/ATPase [Halomonas subterranea]SES22716.1 ATP-binding cassette, subfamily C, LapB [Halomonas subterranea]
MSNEKDVASDEPSNRTDTDELLECLVAVASIHHHDATREALIAGLPLEDGRLTPGVLGRAAARADLTARLVKSRLSQLNPALFPAILLLESGRACVLLNLDIKNGQAEVIFPELGEASSIVSLVGLQDAYSGQAAYVRPKFRFDARGPEVKKQRSRHWFWGVIRENRKLYRDVLIGSAVINLFAVAMPLFVMNVYDRVVPNAATETLWVLAVGIFIVLCFDLALRLMRNAFVDLAASRADVKLTSSIMSRVLGMRMEAKPASTGSFTATLQSFESVRAFIGSATIVALVDLPFVILFAAIIALIGVPLVIPIVVGAVFVFLYALAAQSKLHELSETTWRIGAQRNATLVEAVGNLETVKTLRSESRLQGMWERASAFLSRTAAQLRLVSSSVTSVALWTQHTVAVAIIIIGVYMIIEGDLTQGGLIAAYLLSSRAMAPISQAAGLMAQYHQSSTALESLNEVMDKPTERVEGKAYISRPVVHGDIKFDGVSLSYPEAERSALNDVSFRLKPGEKVALIGRIGSGKSTLSKLLLALYQPTSGAIFLDDVDIRQFDPMQLRRHIGYVPQDIALFFGTLRENIVAGAGSEGVDDEALLEAVRLSGLESLVKSNPYGLDLPVGEGGNMLSGGQRQSVAVARALVNSPSVLLLDEPTSAMDHASEEVLKKNLTHFSQEKTMVIVTHRTSLLSLVDRIIVMDAGKIVADGPREQVVEALRKGQVGRAN